MVGHAVKIKRVINGSALQINEFFGVDGCQSLFGGTRGSSFFVEGVLEGSDASDLSSQVRAFDNIDDGVGRDLVDSYGVTWSNVLFRSFEPGERVIQDANAFWLPYKALFQALT